MQKIGDLEINQDLSFERRSWKVERVAWGVGLLILAAALFGFLGPGPLGKATAASGDKSLSLQYDRVVRCESPVTFRVNVDGRLAKNGALHLWLDRKFVDALKIKHVEPKPELVEINGERFVYVFKTSAAPSTIQVFFHVEPNRFGNASARLGVVDGPEIQFNQFYLP